ncbi:MAG: ABC transporter permease [Deferribacteres bacterium]|nr:ABC transporter permease [Deferribacteres bacterium]
MFCDLWSLEDSTLFVCGRWTLESLEGRFSRIASLSGFRRIDASKLEELDTYGALLIVKLLEKENLTPDAVVSPKKEHIRLILLVWNKKSSCPKGVKPSIVEDFADWLWERLFSAVSFLDFMGRLFLETARGYKDFEIRSLFRDIQEMGARATLIIGVLSFLIGVVIAYQSAAQLARFGANIFIVDLVVLSVVRELSPLIVAVLMSGRSASSYTATIGTMRVNEEIEALEVIGVSPFVTVVLPRVLSLVIVTPLLVVFADFVGIFGGMLVSKAVLGVEFAQFVKRMEMVLSPHHFWAGVIKAPVFGLFVALIGTWKGLTVEKRAESVGKRVIESVVVSIFGVLVIDAAFSVIFRILGI